jgi:hypothetical protein
LYVPKKTSFACFQRFFEPLLCLYFNFVEILAKGKFLLAKKKFLLAKKKFLLANGTYTNFFKNKNLNNLIKQANCTLLEM